jgi:hypothetical protein
MSKTNLLLIALLTGLLTFAIYSYRQSQPPDAEQIERCNAMAAELPESTPEEINRNINSFVECLEQ